MPRLKKTSLSDVLGHLPVIKPLDDGHSAEVDSLFLCALGFEERCLSIPKKLAAAGYQAEQSVYLRYETNEADNDANLAALEHELQQISGKRVDPLDANVDDVCNGLRTLLSGLSRHASNELPRVTVDISVMTNWLILLSLKALLETNVALRVVYAEADVYHPTKEEFENHPDGWDRDDDVALERGVSNVCVSPEHPGHHFDPLPDSVIVFPSFRKDRSRAVLSQVDPTLNIVSGNRVVWVLGAPHLDENEWRIDAMRRINELEGQKVPQYVVSTFDYKDVIMRLEAIYQERCQDYKVTLSVMGSKIQALGAAFFYHLHPDVRIIFAIAREYNAKHYSGGCAALWRLDFGELKSIRDVLDRVGLLAIENGP